MITDEELSVVRQLAYAHRPEDVAFTASTIRTLTDTIKVLIEERNSARDHLRGLFDALGDLQCSIVNDIGLPE